jgi:NAD(P)H-hydrate repair Nnr-like enzyme with NAD(P)H-hydrate dehydratase domain
MGAFVHAEAARLASAHHLIASDLLEVLAHLVPEVSNGN